MDPVIFLDAVATKLSTVSPAGTTIAIIGAVCFVIGWLWLIYQNSRFSIVHGVLSLIPLYALIFAFVKLEHRQKSGWTTMCLAGAVIASLGYSLVFAANDCELNPDCGRRAEQQDEAQEIGDQAAESDDSSVLTPQEWVINPRA